MVKLISDLSVSFYLDENLYLYFILFTGDAKPGHPVTRTGSDRRPDAVREESKNQESHNHAHENEEDTSHGER